MLETLKQVGSSSTSKVEIPPWEFYLFSINYRLQMRNQVNILEQVQVPYKKSLKALR